MQMMVTAADVGLHALLGMGWDGDEFAHLCLATPAIPIFKKTCKSTTKGVLEQATTYRRRWAALPAAGVRAEP